MQDLNVLPLIFSINGKLLHAYINLASVDEIKRETVFPLPDYYIIRQEKQGLEVVYDEADFDWRALFQDLDLVDDFRMHMEEDLLSERRREDL